MRKTFLKYFYKLLKKIHKTFDSFLNEKVNKVLLLEVDTSEEQINFKRENVSCSVILNSIHEYSVKPVFLPEDYWDIFYPVTRQDYTMLIDCSNKDFFFAHNYMFSDKHEVIADSRLVFEHSLISTQYIPRNIKYFNGTICFLSNGWVENYYHWLQFTLPMLQYYKKLIDISSSDVYFYIGDCRLSGFQKETLKMAGVSLQQILHQPCRADRMLTALHFPTSSCGSFIYRIYDDAMFSRKVLLEYISKNKIETPVSLHHEKIFISRRKTKFRKLLNEDEVEKYLQQFGFISFDLESITVAEQARLFNNASFIIGIHGAALANFLFIEKGATVLEIFPANYQEISHFCTASFNEAKYHYMLTDNVNNDLIININKLDRLLKQIDSSV